MRRPVLFLVALTVLSSCAPSVDNWGKVYGKAFCSYAKSCQAADFNASFSSLGACVDQQDAQWTLNLPSVQANCVYDKKEAAKCLGLVGKAKRTCDAADANAAGLACDAVFTCIGGGGVDTAGG